MIRTTHIFAGALLLSFVMNAPPALASGLKGVQIGSSTEQVKSSFGALQWTSGSKPGALRKGLIDSKLLATMTRLRVAPKDQTGALDKNRFVTLAMGEQRGRRYTFAFSSQGKLQAMLIRIPVPVDPQRDPKRGWSKDRLHRLKRALREFSLRPFEKDSYGNVFAWRGRQGGGAITAMYLPQEDELRVLLYR